ncbi:hypothetical protein LA66_03580 [Aureimonas altamirensis]|uniref:Ceramide glucosyltransferase n=1 Tax=Aureimonas altamirensis TaxID=370622 RepID=A0A0B1Q9X1_9HYPH|nr:CHAD domain-containing protein [Aureimonas altamirensis]KHJ55732.1 hypothetical protein LA66_03580 [Aureimonas altamirensis]
MSFPSNGHEIELKLLVDPAEADRLVESDLFGSPDHVRTMHSVYFDTPALDLAKAGFSMRVRESGGNFIQTVKALGNEAAGLMARPEWERELPGPEPMLDDERPIWQGLGDRLQMVAPLFDIDVERRSWTLSQGDSVCEVVLDRGHVRAGDRQAPVCEIEIELKAGEAADLFALARRIDGVVPVWPGVMTKAERGHRLLGPVRHAVRSQAATLSEGMSSQLAFQRIASACLRQFRVNEMQVDPTYPAALHQARVAIRRLRSALSIHKKMLAGEQLSAIRSAFRDLGSTLGEARDLDVLAARMEGSAYLAPVEQARRSAYERAAKALKSQRTRALLLDISEWLSFGDWTTSADTQELRQAPARESSSQILSRQFRRVRKAGRHLAALDDEARHDLRKMAKRLRYATEFYAPLFDDKRSRKRRKRLLDALETLQEALGALNDMAGASQTITRLDLGADAASQIARHVGGDQRDDLLAEAARAHEAIRAAKPFWT